MAATVSTYLPDGLWRIVVSFLPPESRCTAAGVNHQLRGLMSSAEQWQQCGVVRLPGETLTDVIVRLGRGSVAATNMERGKCQTTMLTGHTGPILDVQRLNSVIVTGSRDHTARVWWLKKRRGSVLRHSSWVTKVLPLAVSTTTLLHAGVHTLPEARLLKPERGHRHRRKVTTHPFARQYKGDLVVTGSGDNAVRVWFVTEAAPVVIAKLTGHRHAISALCEVPCTAETQHIVASGDTGGAFRVWRVGAAMESSLMHCLEHHETGITSFKPVSGSVLAAASEDMVSVWNAATGTIIQSWEGQASCVVDDGVHMVISEGEVVRIVSALPAATAADVGSGGGDGSGAASEGSGDEVNSSEQEEEGAVEEHRLAKQLRLDFEVLRLLPMQGTCRVVAVGRSFVTVIDCARGGMKKVYTAETAGPIIAAAACGTSPSVVISVKGLLQVSPERSCVVTARLKPLHRAAATSLRVYSDMVISVTEQAKLCVAAFAFYGRRDSFTNQLRRSPTEQWKVA